MNNVSINNLVLDLARARATEAQFASEAKDIEMLIANSVLGKLLSDAQAERVAAKKQVAIADTALRQAALSSYIDDGNKHPHKATTIKIYTVLEYDETDAITEAIEHFKWTLKLDKRKFDKIAKDADFTFVTKHVDPRVSVSRDLSSYLASYLEERKTTTLLEIQEIEAEIQDRADLVQAKDESAFVADLYSDPVKNN